MLLFGKNNDKVEILIRLTEVEWTTGSMSVAKPTVWA